MRSSVCGGLAVTKLAGRQQGEDSKLEQGKREKPACFVLW